MTKQKAKFELCDTVVDRKREAAKFGAELHDSDYYVSNWCRREACEAEYSPSTNACGCGIGRTHVHCQHGNIIQIG